MTWLSIRILWLGNILIWLRRFWDEDDVREIVREEGVVVEYDEEVVSKFRKRFFGL